MCWRRERHRVTRVCEHAIVEVIRGYEADHDYRALRGLYRLELSIVCLHAYSL